MAVQDLKGSELTTAPGIQAGDKIIGVRSGATGAESVTFPLSVLAALSSSAYQGLATETTDPGTPTGNVYYNAIAGTTYPHFINAAGQPIAIPRLSNSKNVMEPKLIFDGTNWSAQWAELDPADISQVNSGITNKGSGPLDALRGPYATVAEANAAIPNIVGADGKSYREGKIVDVGLPIPIEHTYQGGISNSFLVPRNPAQNLYSFTWGRGQDTSGAITNTENAIVSPFLFVADMKILEIDYKEDALPFITYYKYDANFTPIARVSAPVWKRIQKGITWLEIEPDAVFVRFTIIISSSPATATPIAFATNPKITIRKSISEHKQSDFTNVLLQSKDFTVGKFIADSTLTITTNVNTATSLNPLEISGSTIKLLTLNQTSFFWVKLLYLDSAGAFISSSAWTVMENNKYLSITPPPAAKKIICNIINSSSSTNIASQIAFPVSGFKFKVLEQMPSSGLSQKIANTIIVAKTGGDYTSINAATQAAGAGDTVIVYPGVYTESIHANNKNVNLIGVCRETCIVQMDTAERDNPPGNFSVGYVANLTFLQTAKAPAGGKDIYAATRGSCGYGIHVDWTESTNNKLLIENCNIISYSDPGIGIGLQPNFTLTLRNCKIEQRIDFENHPTTEDIGAIYCHESGITTSAGDGHDQLLILERCTIYNTGKYSIGLSGDHGDADKRSAQIEAINTHFWAETGGSDPETLYSRTPAVSPAISGSNIFLSPKSFGNNLQPLNN